MKEEYGFWRDRHLTNMMVDNLFIEWYDGIDGCTICNYVYKVLDESMISRIYVTINDRVMVDGLPATVVEGLFDG